jgi:dTDP-4-dehydrorhamnose reductase
MTTLVIGANGLVGSNVLDQLVNDGSRVVGTYHSESPTIDVESRQLDITDSEAVRTVFEEIEPNSVLNCAAMTDVDACERAPDRAETVNTTAAATVAELAAETGAALVHFSTDYVFAGDRTAAYTEADEPAPIQVYGETKLAGEEAVFDRHPGPVVVRPSFVYGIHRGTGDLTGFPAWVRNRLRAGNDVPLFTDQRVSPTRAGQVASVVRELLAAGATGLFHATARSCVTPFEFGQRIAEMLDYPSDRLARSSMAAVDREAPRPTNSCLAVDKVESALGRRQPTMRTDLESIAAVF